MMNHSNPILRIIIIGNGIAGSTAARYIRKYSHHDITMISGESEYPYARTALMYVYMGHMTFEHTKMYEDDFWAKNRIGRIKAVVKEILPTNHQIILQDNTALTYDKLVIATGSKFNTFGWPGQELNGVQGLYSLEDLHNMESKTSRGIDRAVIVGGGLIGIEMAEMFHSRKIPVTMLVREKSFWNTVLPYEESNMINHHLLAHGIDLKLNEELVEIKGKEGKVSAVQCKNSAEELPCQFVGLTVGVHPNVELLQSTDIEVNKGVLVNEYLETSSKDIYAIGDCAELIQPDTKRKSIEAVWYAGRQMGQTVAKTICGETTKYHQGVWYNSAKFFDIEYQTYGEIPVRASEQIQSLYWQHPTENKSIRINFDKKTKAVTGFNLMGIRYRQEVCVSWIEQKTNIEEVLSNLSLANFDPEFYDIYENHMVALYNQIEGSPVSIKPKRKWYSLKQLFTLNLF
ncbi:MAG: FAD/NAD(P)-binding oxidoreductase [Saprospiraceae bacterium]